MTWGQRRAIIIIVLAVFLVILFFAAMKPSRLSLPSNAVLVIDATGQIEEQRSPDLFSPIASDLSALSPARKTVAA